MVEQAMGAQALRLLATLDTECASVDQLGPQPLRRRCTRAFISASIGTEVLLPRRLAFLRPPTSGRGASPDE